MIGVRSAVAGLAAAVAVLVPATVVSASPNVACGKVQTARGAVKVSTFGAGADCAAARGVIRHVVRARSIRRSYRGWTCSVSAGRQLSCFNAKTINNAVATVPRARS